MKIGYARVSSGEQQTSLEEQEAILLAQGCYQVFKESVSASSHRSEFVKMLKFARNDDTVVVTKLDRLSRSTEETLSMIDQFIAHDVRLCVLDVADGCLNLGSASVRMWVSVMSTFAEYERELALTRQRTGIERARVEGKYKGRAPTARAKSDEVIRLHEGGMKAATIAKTLNISRASAYRFINEHIIAQGATPVGEEGAEA